MEKRFDLIIFDWDGTLMDSAAHIVEAIRAAAADVGVTVPTPEAARHVIGLGLQDAIAMALPDLPQDRYDELVASYRHHFFTTAIQRQRLFAGVEELLVSLREQRYWLAVATGKGRAGLDRSLEETALGRYFVTSRTADETASKPDPKMLHEILFELDVVPERALMVGDTSYDLEMAARARVPSVGVTGGAHAIEHLLPHQPRTILDDIRELETWLADL
ncbi:MAG: HAD-IA family hydrolase [Gammaproteobacteria bacterium]|nr:HAD-IA family hydrolase [Gammaproteobacteria bacterium]